MGQQNKEREREKIMKETPAAADQFASAAVWIVDLGLAVCQYS